MLPKLLKSCRSPLLCITLHESLLYFTPCPTQPSSSILSPRLGQTSTFCRLRDISPQRTLPTSSQNLLRLPSNRPKSRPFCRSPSLSIILLHQATNCTLQSLHNPHSLPLAIPKREFCGPTTKMERCAVQLCRGHSAPSCLRSFPRNQTI